MSRDAHVRSAHVVRPAARGGAAFTLVELLVVIAIIALLLSLMGPTANRIVQFAQLDKCKGNLHNMGIAAGQYGAANKGYWPRDAHNSQTAHYQFAACLSPWINGKKWGSVSDLQNWNWVYDFLKGEDVFLCPAIPSQKIGGEEYVLNYIVNGHNHGYYKKTGQYHGQGAPASKLTDLTAAPAEILYLVEFNPGYCGAKQFTYYDVFRYNHMPFDGLVPNSNPRMIHADDERHHGETTILFFDGHARTHKLDPYEIRVTMWNPDDRSHDPP